MLSKIIKTALISTYNKDGLLPIISYLSKLGVVIYSTGGTKQYILEHGYQVVDVENITDYPSIFGGRVKTLHPKIFGGILYRREEKEDCRQADELEIPTIDLVIVDLYPFEDTVKNSVKEHEIIEKIDIGGIALIRAAAKNFNDVLVVPSRRHYGVFLEKLEDKKGVFDLNDRKYFACEAFNESSHYDTTIFNYFNQDRYVASFKKSFIEGSVLRYGENPHQKAAFYGDLEELFDQVNGKPLSYNNLVDIDAAISLINEFDNEKAFAIIKHTNACGIATASNVVEAYENALASDPLSAFGGILITNTEVDLEVAKLIDKLFFEVLIASKFSSQALELLRQKKNRILLKQKKFPLFKRQFKSILNGVIEQDYDVSEVTMSLELVTKRQPNEEEKAALIFANKVVKHVKSNAIVLALPGRMIASGMGQTSRVDALRQAIHKAKAFKLDLKGAVMASDAFFPFPDCVQLAHEAGITAVIQPGGSKKDQDSIDLCNKYQMAMVFSGKRSFKH